MIAHNDSLEKKKNKKLIHISEVCIFKKKIRSHTTENQMLGDAKDSLGMNIIPQ